MAESTYCRAHVKHTRWHLAAGTVETLAEYGTSSMQMKHVVSLRARRPRREAWIRMLAIRRSFARSSRRSRKSERQWCCTSIKRRRSG